MLTLFQKSIEASLIWSLNYIVFLMFGLAFSTLMAWMFVKIAQHIQANRKKSRHGFEEAFACHTISLLMLFPMIFCGISLAIRIIASFN